MKLWRMTYTGFICTASNKSALLNVFHEISTIVGNTIKYTEPRPMSDNAARGHRNRTKDIAKFNENLNVSLVPQRLEV